MIWGSNPMCFFLYRCTQLSHHSLLISLSHPYKPIISSSLLISTFPLVRCLLLRVASYLGYPERRGKEQMEKGSKGGRGWPLSFTESNHCHLHLFSILNCEIRQKQKIISWLKDEFNSTILCIPQHFPALKINPLYFLDVIIYKQVSFQLLNFHIRSLLISNFY